MRVRIWRNICALLGRNVKHYNPLLTKQLVNFFKSSKYTYYVVRPFYTLVEWGNKCTGLCKDLKMKFCVRFVMRLKLQMHIKEGMEKSTVVYDHSLEYHSVIKKE